MGKDEDFLFPILVKKGAAISYEAARDQFRKGLKAAGIENIEKFGLHSMGRGSVTALTQAKVSDHLVQKHMRVVSNSTVRRYATLSQEKLGRLAEWSSEPVHSNTEKYCLHKIRCVFPLLHTPLWGTISRCSLPLSSQHSNMGSRLPGFK